MSTITTAVHIQTHTCRFWSTLTWCLNPEIKEILQKSEIFQHQH